MAQGKDRKLKVLITLPDGSKILKEFLSVFVDNEVSTNTATVAIYGDVENKEETLISGSYVQVAPIFDDDQKILVPQAALAQDENGFYAYVIDAENTAIERRLRLGDVIGNRQIVKTGLNNGDKIVIKGVQKLKHGTKVQAETVSTDLKM